MGCLHNEVYAPYIEEMRNVVVKFDADKRAHQRTSGSDGTDLLFDQEEEEELVGDGPYESEEEVEYQMKAPNRAAKMLNDFILFMESLHVVGFSIPAITIYPSSRYTWPGTWWARSLTPAFHRRKAMIRTFAFRPSTMPQPQPPEMSCCSAVRRATV